MIVFKTTLESLDENKVKIVVRKYYQEDDIEIKTNDVHITHYNNSIRDRENIQNNLSEPYLSAVMAMWGDTPTFNEEIN